MLKRIIVTALLVCLAIGAVHAQRARDHIAQGREHLAAQRFEQAIASFEAALRLEPRNRDAPALLRQAQEGRVRQLVSQAETLVRQGSLTEAVAVYNSAIQTAPQGFNTREITAARDRVNSTLQTQQQQAAQAQRQQQEQQTSERAEQSRRALQGANEFVRANKIIEAIAGYENAVSIGGLNQTETNNVQRFITELKNIQTKIEAYNRPLRDDDFDIRQDGGNVIITNFKASENISVHLDDRTWFSIKIGILNVVIPERLHGLPVTGINGFSEIVTSVTIPNTVTVIGGSAFQGNRLERVIIPNSVTRIGDNAFRGNITLTEIIIPDSVTDIGMGSFRDCGLTSVTLGSGIQRIGPEAFMNNKLTGITLPAGLRTIYPEAFRDNLIQSVTIPNRVEHVGSFAFQNNPMTELVITSQNTYFGFYISNYGTRDEGWVPPSGSSPFPNTLTRITLPANIRDKILFPNPWGEVQNNLLEIDFINFYTSQNSRAGTYVKNGPIWSRQQ